ncbi:MAG: hypothetical protein QOC61_1166 [Acidobacteriota bacterium]|jgi:hypothetical protein|nr:hypothetical protein [Acidobacteriota bacterium]MDT5262162.1 hypothetical protein [Acidobacteriota bacterium]
MCEFRYGSLVARTVTLLALLMFTASFATAQVTSGNLQGVVLDPNNAAVAGATVKVTNVDTGQSREVTTNSEGFYRVTNLTPGDKYRVDVTATGFAPKSAENITVRAATENTADLQVGVAGIAGETVQVTGETSLIDSAQSQLSTSYTPQQLTQLPFVGSIDNLALLTPGVVTPGDTDFANGVGISANGNRGRSNNFQIDGQDNNDNSVAGPSLSITNGEAIGDYQVITNSFSAEFGRNSGAQINVVTRSGTNDIHGALFEFHQNSALNARDNIEKQTAKQFNFLTSNGFTQFSGLANTLTNGPTPDHINRFGGRIGGPIVKNKAFYFVTYEGTYDRGQQIFSNVSSGSFAPNLDAAAAANRVFGTATTSTLATIGPANAATGTLLIAPPTTDTNGDGIPDVFNFGPGNPFGNPVTPGFLAPLAVIADSTAPGGRRILFGGEGVRITPFQQSEDQIIGKVDWNLTGKDTLSTRYIFDNARFPILASRGVGGFFFSEPSKNNNLGVTYTRLLSSRTTNEARFNFSRLNVTFGDTSQNPGAGISFSGTRSIAGGLLTSFGPPNNLPQSRVVDVYQLQDTISQTLGNHALKYGADIRHQKVNNFFLPNLFGQYTFANAGASAPANTFFNYGTTGLNGSARTSPTAFENFLLGRFRQVSFALGNPNIKTTQNDYFFFLQDDYRIRPTLTLNLGARYELSTTPFNPIIEQINAREADNSTAIFNTSFPLAFRTAQKIPLDKNNIAPRVGFAWSPNFNFMGDRFREGRTVIRGGFGIAYDPPYFNIVLNTVTAAPFAAVGTFRQTPGGTGAVNFPFLPTTTAQLNGTPGTNGGDPRLFNQTRVDPNLYNPYTMSFNFGVQQEVGRRSVLEVRYVGSRIVGQFQTVNGNPDLRFLEQAGAYFGNPTMFTGGRSPGTCSFDASCQTPTAANSFNTRGIDATGSRILGSGRVDPTFGAIRTRINGASSTYNGMQVRFDTRFTNDLVLNANYTWSKTIDNASEIFSTLGGGQTVAQAQNPFDITGGERGLSAFHQKHNFTTNFLYELPFMKDQKGTMGKILGGFQVGGLIRVGSGRPYTPNDFFGTYDPNFENGFIGAGGLRPFNGNPSAPVGTIAFGYGAACDILFGGPECDYNGGAATPGSFIVFNTGNVGSTGTVVSASQVLQSARLIYNDFGLNNQFGEPLSALEAFNLFKTPFGNVGRSTFFGEMFSLANLSLFKTTNITENVKVEFRAEAFNILNHRNYGVPDVVTEDASNGFTTSTFQNPGFNNGGNRSVRFGLRLIF